MACDAWHTGAKSKGRIGGPMCILSDQSEEGPGDDDMGGGVVAVWGFGGPGFFHIFKHNGLNVKPSLNPAFTTFRFVLIRQTNPKIYSKAFPACLHHTKSFREHNAQGIIDFKIMKSSRMLLFTGK